MKTLSHLYSFVFSRIMPCIEKKPGKKLVKAVLQGSLK